MLDIYCLEIDRSLERADFERLVAEMPRATGSLHGPAG